MKTEITNIRTLRECLGISAGTLSYLVGSTRYDEIESARYAWFDWLLANPAGNETWMQAWERYQTKGTA